MTPGTYVLDVAVPMGYHALIDASGTPTENDIFIYGRLIGGAWKFLTVMDDTVLQNFSITVNIEPIPGYSVPWGIGREDRG